MKMVKQRKFQIKACAAAAALCVVGSAHADTDNSVTLYGIADVGLMYLSHSTPELNGGMSNGHQISLTNSGYSPSLWGIKGVEDLGGGFKAQFNLESGISMVNGGFDNPGDNKGLFNRVADVGISGNFGKVMAGLQFSPFFELIYDLDPRDSSMFGSMLVPVSEQTLAAATFMPNSVSYTSPSFGGFQLSGLYALGGVAGSFSTGRAWSVAAKYSTGTLLIGAAYIDVNNADDVALATANPLYAINSRAWTVGASYKFGGLTGKASFANFKANSLSPLLAGLLVPPNTPSGTSLNTSVNVYSGGVDYFVLPYLDVNAGIYYQQDRVNSGGRSITGAIGTQFFLSKRTSLYAQLGFVNNKCAGDGVCLGSGLSVENAGSGTGGMQGAGTVGSMGLGLPPGTTVGANIGIRTTF
jgi:predicted porin